jgi:hypothetical protein
MTKHYQNLNLDSNIVWLQRRMFQRTSKKRTSLKLEQIGEHIKEW